MQSTLGDNADRKGGKKVHDIERQKIIEIVSNMCLFHILVITIPLTGRDVKFFLSCDKEVLCVLCGGINLQ